MGSVYNTRRHPSSLTGFSFSTLSELPHTYNIILYIIPFAKLFFYSRTQSYAMPYDRNDTHAQSRSVNLNGHDRYLQMLHLLPCAGCASSVFCILDKFDHFDHCASKQFGLQIHHLFDSFMRLPTMLVQWSHDRFCSGGGGASTCNFGMPATHRSYEDRVNCRDWWITRGGNPNPKQFLTHRCITFAQSRVRCIYI